MPLSIFVDALPFNEMKEIYKEEISSMQIAELVPNIAYSSSLHWQLYCNKYPDERGVMVDWVKEEEKRKSVRFVSLILSPFENIGLFGVLAKKVLDRKIYRRNTFANIPFKLRKHFSQKGKYLFWKEATYRSEPIFDGYTVISQDEGHKSFEETILMLEKAVCNDKNIFAVFGFADMLGHKCRRGELYSERLRPYMEKLFSVIDVYKEKNPDEEILIVSDHGMSTVKKKIDLELEKEFGKQSEKTYIAYCDTAVMCIWAKDENLSSDIADYLRTRDEGHLLTEEEREFYGVTDRLFGDLIYILREGNVFADNWFGKSIKKGSGDGSGMHGFWPEREAKDQMACIILGGGKHQLSDVYNYKEANELINEVMKGGE